MEKLNSLPWWALSPSPFSLAFYAILIIIGIRKLIKINEYKRFKHLVAFSDSFFIVGFAILLGDLSWSIICALRFGSMFPKDLLQITLVIARNFVGLLLCYLLVVSNLRWTRKTTRYVAVNIMFQIVWFALAAGPQNTDWTYALKNGYSLATIVQAFFVSHVVGKAIVALIWKNLW